jgi:demethylmenaquinone methyltransferase/2-methoxy-6-polyprenyl-1,4-benzoquinol methylase
MICSGCGSTYRSDGGIFCLLADEADPSRDQAEWFDAEVDAEFEIERPRGAPALHSWLLEHKFARAVQGLDLAGKTALVVCGGSGLDAEFLARRGALVVSSDISAGAVERTLARARRHGFDVCALVADATRLPFADESIDVVYVHDGLHHLPDPLAGLDEMARVARSHVCISEPARAALTSWAVRAGVALEREEAGNAVARLSQEEVSPVLEARGFRVTAASRYAMFYRHEPKWAVRRLSHPAAIAPAKLAWRLANLALGRFGNKLCVQASKASALEVRR